MVTSRPTVALVAILSAEPSSKVTSVPKSLRDRNCQTIFLSEYGVIELSVCSVVAKTGTSVTGIVEASKIIAKNNERHLLILFI